MRTGARRGPAASAGPAAPPDAAGLLLAAYHRWHERFRGVTARARGRFERREWAAVQDDAVERLLLYPRIVAAAVDRMERALGERARDPGAWEGARESYRDLTEGMPDAEVARTFFNSVSRRVLGTVGVCRPAEFLGADLDLPWAGAAACPTRRIPVSEADGAPGPESDGVPGPDALRTVLSGLGLRAPWADLDRDVRLASDALRAQLSERADVGPIRAIEVVGPPFFRNKGAYVVGRMLREGEPIPLCLALVHGDEGVAVDAVLTTSDELSIVFGFSRSYFHVELERPRPTVDFLAGILPRKRLDELYTAIGYNRHGKSELYRTLVWHLARTELPFQRARGTEGMVMAVFTLPSLNVVFKLIKDRFGPTKNTTRRQVKERYKMVFLRDRVGRLADAQEFEALEFPLARFQPDLLEWLLGVAGGTVRPVGDRLVVDHLYTVRRMTPLDLYVRQADPDAARAAVIDYGYAIRDLAAANVFPGDLLLKNFGVTRHGRVVFYDYDELTLLSRCVFREMPRARTYQEELSAEPWFHVGENDVFPEEFPRFLGLPPELAEAFHERHSALFTPEFWRRMQERNEAGEIVDVFPYRQRRRLRRD